MMVKETIFPNHKTTLIETKSLKYSSRKTLRNGGSSVVEVNSVHGREQIKLEAEESAIGRGQ